MGDVRSSVSTALRAFALADETGSVVEKSEAALRLAKGYDLLNDHERAYRMLETHITLRDSLFSLNNQRGAIEQEERFKYEKKALADSLASVVRIERAQNEHALELAQQRNQRNIAWGSTGLVSLLLISGALLVRSGNQRRSAQHSRETAELRLKASEFQNRALRAQMEPHFIRNTIALAIARLNNGTPTANDDASELLARFSDWIDKVLVTSQHATHALRDELNTLGHYLELQRLRSKGKLLYNVTVDPSLDADRIDVPPMLLQPLIENAIEHGLEPRGGEGRITLSAVQREGSLVLCAEDDGVGRNHPKPEGHVRKKSTSVSTANIREQLAMLAARTGKRAELRIIDLPQGTRAEVWLPM